MKPYHGRKGELRPTRAWKIIPFLTIALMAAILWPEADASAQEKQDAATVSPLKIGERLPDSVWSLPLAVVNHPEGKKTITLNEYKGKLIILEFWATWCGPCIAKMPHLLDLQEHFKDEIAVLPLTPEPRELISSILKNSPSKGIEALRKRSFATLVEDRVLHQFFPTGSIPRTVVLDGKGTVKAITLPEFMSESTIEGLLNGSDPYIPYKTEAEHLPPLLTFSLDDVRTYKPVYYSTIMGELDGVIGKMNSYQVDSANRRIRYIARNNPILLFYAFTGWYMAGVPSRRILEVNDPSKYTYYYDEETKKNTMDDVEWRRKNRYTYEAVLPLTFTKESFFQRMRRDLDDFFNVHARVEKREVKCWVLKRLEDSAPSFVSKEGDESLYVANGILYRRMKGDTLLGPSESGALTYVRNTKMSLFVINCLKEMDTFYRTRAKFFLPPILNETGYTGKVDVDLPDKFTGLEDLRSILRPQGLDLVPEVRKIDMFVLTEPGYETSGSSELRMTKFGYVPVHNP